MLVGRFDSISCFCIVENCKMLDVAVEMNMVLFQGSRFEVKRWLDRDGAKNCYIRVDVKGGRTSTGVSYAVVHLGHPGHRRTRLALR